VAITRARELLYMTFARSRKLYGGTLFNPRSEFINEIPEQYLQLSGVGSEGYAGVGWEKRGDRRGIYGSGTSHESNAHVYGSGQRKGSGGGIQKEQQQAPRVVYTVGDEVDHKVFGRGVVKRVDGDELHVRFNKSGETKRLLASYAPLVKIN
jgi:DNA helicase-2/ATP-dependent DNA helicase PcrA